jgi:mitochondrial import receptor subunit TOM40
MSDAMAEKTESASSPSFWSAFSSNAMVSRATSLVSTFQQKREELALPNPANADNLFKEVERDVLLNNYTYTGLRADLTRVISAVNPLFQVSHAFTMGSQTQPPYQFAVLYGSPLVRFLLLPSPC